jgi:hypothetical protein
MISFEWLEFETLSREVADLEDQLREAKTTKNHGRWQILEPQLAWAKERREKALEAITRHAASTATVQAPYASEPNLPPRPVAVEGPPAPVESQRVMEQRIITTIKETLPALSPSFHLEGACKMWDRLTPAHLNQAQQDLAHRREEMLARHAEELQTIEAEEEHIETLRRAIETFLGKFAQQGPEAEVVQLTQKREALAS